MRSAAAAALLVVGLGLGAGAGACKRQQEEPPGGARPAPIGAVELKRGRDACEAYVEAVCACARTVPAAAQACSLARALPDSIELATEVSAHPDTERVDSVQSVAAVRKTIARCIEGTAHLPALGCAAPAPGR